MFFLEKYLGLTTALIIIIPTLKALIGGAPWVPTPYKAVNKMLKNANLETGDTLYDLGCGDGRIVHLAAKKYGVNAVGFELSPLIYFMAKIRSLCLNSKAKIKFKNFKNYDLSQADVITCYLMPNFLERLKPKFKSELKKEVQIISYAFNIKGWKEIKKIPRDKKNKLAPIWIYEIGKT